MRKSNKTPPYVACAFPKNFCRPCTILVWNIRETAVSACVYSIPYVWCTFTGVKIRSKRQRKTGALGKNRRKNRVCLCLWYILCFIYTRSDEWDRLIVNFSESTPLSPFPELGKIPTRRFFFFCKGFIFFFDFYAPTGFVGKLCLYCASKPPRCAYT